MRTLKTLPGFSLNIVALALLSAFGSAYAEEDVAALARPDSSVSVGAAGVTNSSKDRSFFGQYSGLRREDGYLLLDLDFIKRDDATGTWTTLQGRDLGWKRAKYALASKSRATGNTRSNTTRWSGMTRAPSTPAWSAPAATPRWYRVSPRPVAAMS